MHRQVAHVTEQDHIAVLTLAVIADAAHGVFVDEGAGVGLATRADNGEEGDALALLFYFLYNSEMKTRFWLPCCGSRSTTPSPGGP